MHSHLHRINQLIYSDRYEPRWGWHDDHREVDRTPEYLPALMQVKSEFTGIVAEIFAAGLQCHAQAGRCLQLGMGECRASHEVWGVIFGNVVTIDLGVVAIDHLNNPGLNTHDPAARKFALAGAPYDFLWIDAGHDLNDVTLDFEAYSPMVRKGGIIAMHDALPRDAFPEIGVWAHVEWLRGTGRAVQMIGTEVGIAWMRA